MEALLFGLAPIFIMIAFYVALSVVGVSMERKLEVNLAQREAAIGTFPLFDLKSVPHGVTASQGALVTGNVVMGTGYLKQFLASFRQLVGGEVKGFQRVMNNARREAQLRMIESAVQQGATTIINVRFETSDVGGSKPVAEVFCYGTMIR